MTGNDSRNDVARYLEGAMSPEEERAFAQRMANDPELRLKLDAEQLIRTSIAASVEAIPRPPMSSRQRLEQIALSAPPPGTASPPSGIGGLSGTMLAIGGALIAAIIVIGFLLFQPEQQESVRDVAPSIGRIDTPSPAQLPPTPTPAGEPVSRRSDTPAPPRTAPISRSHIDSTTRSAPAHVDTSARTATTSSPTPIDSTHVRIKLQRPKINRPSESDQKP